MAAPGEGGAGARALAPALPLVGELVLGGKYRIDHALGAGGMGVVMAAEHITLGRKVAFKFLKPGEASGEVTERFVREARAAARIDNEHVVRVSDVGVLESGVAYMLMERLEGEDLSKHLRRVGPLSVERAVLYAVQACDAVAAAHAAGVVHRDLKPSNLFLARRPDGSPAVKVLDFGISKASSPAGAEPDQRLTQPGTVLGSPRYMSPEQLRDSRGVDARTDIWSLGAVVHELLTGAPMYEGGTPESLFAVIVSDPPPPLRAKRPDAPPGLEAVVARCARKDPADRFASVAELALALAPFGPPEAAPIAARAARRLGESRRLYGPPPGGGVDPQGTPRSASVAILTAAPRPAFRHSPIAAAAFGALSFGAAALGTVLYVERSRHGPRGEASPPARLELASPSPPAAGAAPPVAARIADAGPSAPAPASAAHAAPSALPTKRVATPRPAKHPADFDADALLNRR